MEFVREDQPRVEEADARDRSRDGKERIMIELEENDGLGARIKVIGVGGAGGNAVNTMIESGVSGVEFLAANTDAQVLRKSQAPTKIQLGTRLTRGRGAGGNPDVGREAALEDRERLKESLEGADMVFITAGMGGGTGTGAAPIVGEVCRELGALAVAVVTKPFQFEGARRLKQAVEGLGQLRRSVDSLITISNDRLKTLAGKNMTFLEAYKKADDVLVQAVRGIADIITVPGLVNVDFADVRSVMNEMGLALMGSGTASGENRALEAAQKAVSSPLLEDVTVQGAKGVLINVSGTSQMTLHEVDEACTFIQSQVHEEANIIYGAVVDDGLGELLRVTVIASGFSREEKVLPAARSNGGREERKTLHAVAAPTPFFRREKPMGPDLSKVARALGAEVLSGGMTLDDDQYDIPTFLRKQAD